MFPTYLTETLDQITFKIKYNLCNHRDQRKWCAQYTVHKIVGILVSAVEICLQLIIHQLFQLSDLIINCQLSTVYKNGDKLRRKGYSTTKSTPLCFGRKQ